MPMTYCVNHPDRVAHYTYHLPDGTTVELCTSCRTAMSDDEGEQDDE